MSSKRKNASTESKRDRPRGEKPRTSEGSGEKASKSATDDHKKLLAELFHCTGNACGHNLDRTTVWSCAPHAFTLAVADTEGDLDYFSLRNEMVQTMGYVAANELGVNYKYTYEWLSCLKKYMTETEVRGADGDPQKSLPDIVCRQFRDRRHPWIVHRVPFYKYYEINVKAFLQVVVGDCDVNGRSTEMGPFIYRFVKLCAYICTKHFSPICAFGHRWSVQTSVAPGTNQRGPTTPFLRVVYDCKRPECNLRLHAVLRNRPAKTHSAVYLHVFGQSHRSLSVLAKGREVKNDNINSIGHICTACFVEKFVHEQDKHLLERTVMKFVPQKRQAQLKSSIRAQRDLEAKLDVRELLNVDYIYGLIRRTNTSPNHRDELNPTIQKIIFQMLGFQRLPFEVIRKWLLHYISVCRTDPKFASGHGRHRSLFDAEIFEALSEDEQKNVTLVKDTLLQTFVDDRAELRTAQLAAAAGFASPSVARRPSATAEIRDERTLEGMEIARFLDEGEIGDDIDIIDEDIGENDLEMEANYPNASQEGESLLPKDAGIGTVKEEVMEEEEETSIFTQELPFVPEEDDDESPPQSPSFSRQNRRGVRRRPGTERVALGHDKRRSTVALSQSVSATLSNRFRSMKSRAAAAERRSEEKDRASRSRESQTENPQLCNRKCQTRGFRSDTGAQTEISMVHTEEIDKMAEKTEDIKDHEVFEIRSAAAGLCGVAVPCRNLSDLVGNSAENLFVPLNACLTARHRPTIEIANFMKKQKQAGAIPVLGVPRVINSALTCDLGEVVGKDPTRPSYETSELVAINDRVYIPLAALRK